MRLVRGVTIVDKDTAKDYDPRYIVNARCYQLKLKKLKVLGIHKSTLKSCVYYGLLKPMSINK